MARLPLRVLGLFLLTLSIGLSSCQAAFHSLAPLASKPADPDAVTHQPR